ncbi:MAG TPA: DUF86 domain-containing protein [Cyclobacteriaceae bacterium]|nr:DUF86 domain-containing protein [Cyclobacteriaceae bacterium]
MSKRLPSSVIKDMLNSIGRLELYTHNIDFKDFSSNYMLVEACLYNIQIIGEAVSQLSEEIKSGNSNIPWILIKGMRNRLIHEYFGTDLPIVWNVIKNELPGLKSELEKIYDGLQQKGN